MLYVLWFVRILVAAIFLQTLFFKFTGAPESVALFTKLGVEPWGRYLSGIVEFVAALLLLLPAMQYLKIGAGLSFAIGVGAVLSHLFVLGIVSNGDGGVLFALACVVVLGSGFVLYQVRY